MTYSWIYSSKLEAILIQENSIHTQHDLCEAVSLKGNLQLTVKSVQSLYCVASQFPDGLNYTLHHTQLCQNLCCQLEGSLAGTQSSCYWEKKPKP